MMWLPWWWGFGVLAASALLGGWLGGLTYAWFVYHWFSWLY
jgi:hypothetical protein